MGEESSWIPCQGSEGSRHCLAISQRRNLTENLSPRAQSHNCMNLATLMGTWSRCLSLRFRVNRSLPQTTRTQTNWEWTSLHPPPRETWGFKSFMMSTSRRSNLNPFSHTYRIIKALSGNTWTRMLVEPGLIVRSTNSLSNCKGDRYMRQSSKGTIPRVWAVKGPNITL